MQPVPRWKILWEEFRQLIKSLPFSVQFWRIVSYGSIDYLALDMGTLFITAKAAESRRRFTLFWFRVSLDARMYPHFNLVLGGFGIHVNTFTGRDRHVTLPVCYELPIIGLVWPGMSRERQQEIDIVSRSNHP